MTATDHRDDYAGQCEAFRWRVPADLNMGRACSAHRREAVAIIDAGDGSGPERRLTYGDLDHLSNRFANALSGAGLTVGDRIAVVLPQCLEAIVVHLGGYKSGAIVVPLTTLLGPDALTYRCTDARIFAVVTDTEHEELVRAAVSSIPGCRVMVVENGAQAGSFWDFTASGSAQDPGVATTADLPALMIYTSGTTGAAKGALHGHRVLYGHLPGFNLAHNDFAADAVTWTPADWSWIGGLFDLAIPTLFHGGTLLANRRRAFAPEESLRLMTRHGVTNCFLPPTALRMLTNEVTTAPSGHRLRSLITGGESLDTRTSDWGLQFLGLQINEMYGQTEANFIAGSSAHWPRRAGSLGRPYPGHRIAVLDSDRQPCPPGEPGEIALGLDDPVAMLRYWDNESATLAKMHDGWLFTGDLATCDADGYLTFASRNDDIINSAGYRIGPAEVENCLRDHPQVLEAAVIGVPDEVRGQRVKAVVVVRRPDPDLEAQLRAHVRARLGHYQYPREFTFVSELPKTTTGKIRRQALREGWELNEGRDFVVRWDTGRHRGV